MRGTETGELARRYRRLLADERSAETAKAGLNLIRQQFAVRAGIGVELAVRSAGVLADPDELAGSCEVLAGDLLAALEE